MTNEIEKYARQVDEDRIHFKWFKHYRDMGPTRSFSLVASYHHITVDELKKVSETWQIRVDAWDAEMDRLDIEMQKLDRMRATIRRLNNARFLQEIGMRRFEGDIKEVADQLTPVEAKSFIIDGAKQERLELGEPTEYIKDETDTLRDFENTQDYGDLDAITANLPAAKRDILLSLIEEGIDAQKDAAEDHLLE